MAAEAALCLPPGSQEVFSSFACLERNEEERKNEEAAVGTFSSVEDVSTFLGMIVVKVINVSDQKVPTH